MHRKPEFSLNPPLRRLAGILALAVALGACSRDLPAQSAPRAAVPAVRPAADNAPTAPAGVDGVVRGLPDFSSLVDRYGPAVVNVEVVEKPQAGGGAQGLSPD